jgi:hypothetical protein
MCQHAECQKKGAPPVPGSEKWGLSGGLCQDLIDRTKQTITQRCAAVSKNYVDDFVRVYTLMTDTAKVLAYLEAFSNEIQSYKDPDFAEGKTLKWFRLSDALRYYETKCWFPPDILLPLGLLSSDDFLYYIRLGYVLKDYGAGVRHGEFTHRLQWHAVMRAVTNNFLTADPKATGWVHTPLDLYTSLGTREHGNLWAFFFDRTSADDYRGPDMLHADLVNGKVGGPLQTMVAGRETKRRTEAVDLIVKYMEDTLNMADAKTLAGNYDLSTHNGFKQFEYWFMTKVLAPAHGLNVATQGRDIVTKHNKDVIGPAHEAYKDHKTDPNFQSKYEKKRYIPVGTGHGAVYQMTKAPIMDEQEADTRVHQSYGKFNPDARL